MSQDKLGRAKAATVSAVRVRDSANANARKAIKMILAALADVIGEESLRGLPNLATSSSPYRAVRVLATKRSNNQLPKDGRLVLCINMRGQLVFANFQHDLTVVEQGVHEIKAEWAEDVAEAAIAAIDCHLRSCEKAEERYGKLLSLSQRLVAALEAQP
jgi:hypothetical protein